MNSKQKKIKNNKKVRIFLVFLFLAFFFWMLIKLSAEYETTTNVELTYTDIPENKLLQNVSENQLAVKLKSIGFNLFRNKVSRKNIEISLKSLKRKKGNIYYVLSNNITSTLDDKFSKSKVISVKPDTLFFDLGKSSSKKLRVIPTLDINYELGYSLSGNLKVEPEFITVSGPESEIDTMLNVYTEQLTLNDVNKSIDKKLSIIKGDNLKHIQFSNEEVHIIGLVEKFTEHKIEVDFSVVNLPKDYQLTTYPKKVELVFQVGLADFNTVTADDFKIVCDFVESTNNELNYLIPKLKEKSALVQDVKIIPNKIEFLIKK